MSIPEPDRPAAQQPDDAPPDAAGERAALIEQIEDTREELGATVEALAHKADIKAQVHEKLERRKEHLQHKQVEATGKLRRTLANPAVPTAVAAAGVLLLLLGRRRRRRAA